MLDHTRMAFKKTLDDLKKALFIFTTATQALYIAYLAYSVFTGRGIFYLNVALLTIAAAYFVFYLYINARDVKKKVKKFGARVYKYSKLFINFLAVGVMVYGLITTAESVTATSLILTLLTAVTWVFQLLFQIVISVLESRVNLILDGLKLDIEAITKPVTATKNFFKKLTGQEVKESEPIKNRDVLVGLVEERKTELRTEKEQIRIAKAQEKQNEKAARLAEKQARKEAKKKLRSVPASDLSEETAVTKVKKK